MPLNANIFTHNTVESGKNMSVYEFEFSFSFVLIAAVSSKTLNALNHYININFKIFLRFVTFLSA